MLKVVFMGTPDFAIPSLKTICDSKNKILAVVTQPDRPKGRGKKTTSPPVKIWAEKNNIPVYQPQRAKDPVFIETIRSMGPDLIVTAAYGQLLSKELLDIPDLGCINVHASILPKYRGASPIQQALIEGDEKTGVTIMYMDVTMDTGDIIIQKELEIFPDENAGELHDRLSHLGGELMHKVLGMFERGKVMGIPQDDKKATYCSKIDKSMGEIKWDNPALSIRNLIRGLTPWPGAYTFLGDKRLKVWKASEWEYSKTNDYMPGMIVESNTKNGIVVCCGSGYLKLDMIQPEGGKVMNDIDFIRGNTVKAGTFLGRDKL